MSWPGHLQQSPRMFGEIWAGYVLSGRCWLFRRGHSTAADRLEGFPHRRVAPVVSQELLVGANLDHPAGLEDGDAVCAAALSAGGVRSRRSYDRVRPVALRP